jgi:hypothetical protein
MHNSEVVQNLVWYLLIIKFEIWNYIYIEFKFENCYVQLIL